MLKPSPTLHEYGIKRVTAVVAAVTLNRSKLQGACRV